MKKYYVLSLVLCLIPVNMYASPTLQKARKYIPLILKYKAEYWPDLCPVEIIPAQIEKESGWNVYAERKVGKEYGFGLSQITIVKGKFNNFLSAKRRWKKELYDWKWSNRFAPEFHVKYLILYDKLLYNHVKFAENKFERYAFMLSAYNGGLGNVYKERKLVRVKGLYNPNKWFCNVEKVCLRKKVNCRINRYYVRKILLVNIFKYKQLFTGGNKYGKVKTKELNSKKHYSTRK